MSIEKNNDCIICLEPISDHNQNIIKDCEHSNYYHNECINNWIQESINKNLIPTCPVCDEKIKFTEITVYIPDTVIRIPESNQNNQCLQFLQRYNHMNTYAFFSIMITITVIINLFDTNLS